MNISCDAHESQDGFFEIVVVIVLLVPAVTAAANNALCGLEIVTFTDAASNWLKINKNSHDLTDNPPK
jgi:uncharacterized membrane protein